VRRLVCQLLLLVPMVLGVGGSALGVSEGVYVLQTELWVGGERQPTEDSIVAAGQSIAIDTDKGYRLELTLRTSDDSFAPFDAVWLRLDVFSRDQPDEEWALLTDTLLGARLGQPQVFRLADGMEPADKKDAKIYLMIEVKHHDD